MSTAELKNSLHRMVVETDDPLILRQVAALFASFLGKADWWDLLSEEEKSSIDQGIADKDEGRTSSYSSVKEHARKILDRG